MYQDLVVTCGIPGIGKSTWVAEDSKQYPMSKIVSRDSIRYGLLKTEEGYFDKEDLVFQEFINRINSAINSGYNKIYVDATHISPSSRYKVLSKIVRGRPIRLIFEVFEPDLTIALERNAKRVGRAKVPEDAIRSMAKNFVEPTYKELEKYNFNSVSIRVHCKENQE